MVVMVAKEVEVEDMVRAVYLDWAMVEAVVADAEGGSMAVARVVAEEGDWASLGMHCRTRMPSRASQKFRTSTGHKRVGRVRNMKGVRE